MVKFNKLKIDADGKTLLVNAEVRTESYFDNVYIKSVKIDTQDTYTNDGMPSQNAITVASYGDEDYIKSVDLQLTELDLNGKNILKNFFIVYIETQGTPSSDVPCRLDNIYTIGAVYNMPSIYSMGLNLIKSMGNQCEVSPQMLDFLAKKDGIEYALDTGNLPEAVEYWKSFFSTVKTPTITNRCCCNG